jgi:hypothetical protein
MFNQNENLKTEEFDQTLNRLNMQQQINAIHKPSGLDSPALSRGPIKIQQDKSAEISV